MNRREYHHIFSGPWKPGLMLPIHSDEELVGLHLCAVEALLASPPPEITLVQLAGLNCARETIVETDRILARLTSGQPIGR